jgi:pimeloyl-ACP methyl ester carboxylesterase
VKRVLKILGGAVLVLVLVQLAGVRCDRPAAEVAARHATPPSRFLELDGLRVHYRDRGQGPPIVLLHGANASLFTWEGWARELARDHRVIALDLPGHGLTGPDPRQRYSYAQMAELVDEFAARLGLSRFTVAGNSMGGGVAWHLALAHPERIERLILVDAAGYPREEPRPFALRMQSSPLGGRLARWVTPRFLVAASVRQVYGDPTRVDDALIDQYQDLILREGNREVTRRRFALPDDGASRRIPELRVPTLILWGGRDAWIAPHYGERFAREIPGAQLAMFPSLGHVPQEEDPAATAARVRQFLDGK